jgi:hypothetical protein
MRVTFTRTGERRYRVSVEGPGVVSSHMEPAAGYDERLPHDMAHFVVENVLGINGGVFGQLAAGGHAHSFRSTVEQKNGRGQRKGDRISLENRKDAEMSERVIDIACHLWTNRPYGGAQVKGVTPEDIELVCREFDAVSSVWSDLAVGESMTLDWKGTRGKQKHVSRRK